jgi:hypothetical protein
MTIPCRSWLLSLIVMLVAGSAGAEQFDRTVPASRDTNLKVRLFGGQVIVHAWDKDAVRVRATHFATDQIEVRAEGRTIGVGARARLGTPHAIDFTIDVPAWMAIDLAGTYLDISVEGTRAAISAQTVRGDIEVKGGAGTIVLKSVEGEVVLEGALGRAELSSTNNGVRVTALDGDLLAETVSGSVTLRGVAASRVDVSTMSGDIDWDGTMKEGGQYLFATHDGDMDVRLAERASATILVRAFEGDVRSTFPLQLPDAAARRKGFTFVLGSGASRVELETFRGVITLRRPQPQ